MHTLNKIIIGFSCLAMVCTLQAENISSYSSVNTHVSRLETINNLNDLNQADFNLLKSSQQNQVAKQYDLTKEEYKKYLYVKNDTAIGQYYADRNLSPQYLLADYYLSIGNKLKSNEYIKKYAVQEHAEVARQLVIQKQFQHFAQIQFPTETPIKLKGSIPKGYITYGFQAHNNVITSTFNFLNNRSLTSNAKYILVEDINHDEPNLNVLVSQLQQLNNIRLDIYFLGSKTSDNEIFKWAKKYSLGEYLQSKLVTLNHANKFVPQLSKDLKTNLQAGALVKNQNSEYHILDMETLS